MLAICVCVAPVAARPDANGWTPHVAEASARFGVPQDWIWRVMAVESRGRTMSGGRPIRSSKGAMGLMQLMPETWRQMRVAYDLGNDPDDPHDNILAGTAYLRLMYDRFGYPGLFAAYNAGPGRYRSYLSGTAPLPRETSRYVANVSGGARLSVPPIPIAAGLPTIFAIDRSAVPANARLAPASSTNSLVVIRRD